MGNEENYKYSFILLRKMKGYTGSLAGGENTKGSILKVKEEIRKLKK